MIRFSEKKNDSDGTRHSVNIAMQSVGGRGRRAMDLFIRICYVVHYRGGAGDTSLM